MNTEQIEVANIKPVPHGKFTMTWDPATGNWKAALEAFAPTDAIINALDKMKFQLHMANFGTAMEQQSQAQQTRIEVAGHTPPPPNFPQRRR